MATSVPHDESDSSRRLAYAEARHSIAAIELARAYVEGDVPADVRDRYMKAAGLYDAEVFNQAQRDRAAGIAVHPSVRPRLHVVDGQ